MIDDNASIHDLTIVVNTCDSYEDVLGIFFHAMKDCWPDCPFPVVINTETNSHSFPARVNNYSNGTDVDNWGDRLRSVLNSINTKYVLMLYDDFILDAPVDNARVQVALQLLKMQANAVVTYLINTDLPLVVPHGDENLVLIKDNVDYRLNSAPAIWRKQALMDYTEAGDTPWAWEVFGSYRTWGNRKLFYTINPNHTDIYPYNYSKGGAIYRGKWVKEVVESVSKKYSLNIDWKKRGFSSDTLIEKRSLIWKIRFMKTGFNMVGFKALRFFPNYIKAKFHAK
jgi:hypothetical protein